VSVKECEYESVCVRAKHGEIDCELVCRTAFAEKVLQAQSYMITRRACKLLQAPLMLVLHDHSPCVFDESGNISLVYGCPESRQPDITW
jgi:hypothetical protein